MKSSDGLYCDGGCISVNPSPFGGTWAWCLVREGAVVRQGSGIVAPGDLGAGKVSNNLAELLAAVRGLEAVLSQEPHWRGVLYTDSRVTLLRLTTGKGFKNVPNGLRLRTLDLRRNRTWSAELVAGHPTRADLERGCRSNGRPVSPFNVACDAACSRLARDFMENHYA